MNEPSGMRETSGRVQRGDSGPMGAEGRTSARFSRGRRPRPARARLLPFLLLLGVPGCAAAMGAVAAAGEIRQGIAGVSQLVASARSGGQEQVEVVNDLTSPIAGTYRAQQVLGDDTVQFYLRTADRAAAPIIDEAGGITGYVLPGIVAASLDTLESRVQTWAVGDEGGAGKAMLFIEGTQQPNPNGRTLYPAAFLGRVARGESAAADRQYAELARLDVEMEAPESNRLTGRVISAELFGTVAEGIFTLRPGPNAGAEYQQEEELEDGRTLILRFERMSGTTLPR
jgi:hypothetical protein